MKTKLHSPKQNHTSSKLFEKATLALAVTALMLASAARVTAGPLANEYGASDGISNLDAPTTAKATAKAKVKKIKPKSSRSNNLFSANKNKSRAQIIAEQDKAIRRSKKTSSLIDQEIANETKGLEKLVAANDTNKAKALQFVPKSKTMAAAPTNLPAPTLSNTTSTKVETPAAATESQVSGGVEFTFGRDSNLDADKEGVKGTYYTIDPSLSFKAKNWSGSFGASVKDFTDQSISQLNKSNDIKASFSYAADITEITKSTTTLSGGYHDEMGPDYLSGLDINLIDRGLNVRYTDGKLAQKFDFKLADGFKTSLGGSYLHRENSNQWSDFAANILDPRLFTQSFNEYNAFGRVAVELNKSFEIAAKPSVTERSYTQRESRQSDGSTGGWLMPAPLRKLLTSEVGFEFNVKVGNSSFGPTFSVGQVSDEGLAGENSSYYGAGLKADLALNEDLKLTLSPSVNYKQMKYDNWTNNVDDGGKRRDFQFDTGVNLRMMFTKNIGWGVGYAYSNYRSNYVDTSSNFHEEIVNTTAVFTF
jgi:hypothetical protein